MGQWGEESCSGDSCWDLLEEGLNDFHNIKQIQVEDGLDRITNNLNYSSFEKLGCIIWILRHGFQIPKRFLEIAKDWPDQLLNDKEHMCEWRDLDARKKHLKQEKEDIETALKGDGSIPKKHIPSLFEKIGEAIHERENRSGQEADACDHHDSR